VAEPKLTKDSSATIGAPLASFDSAANTAGGRTPSSVCVTVAAAAGERLDGGLYGPKEELSRPSDVPTCGRMLLMKSLSSFR
jgi:hypothetical protein